MRRLLALAAPLALAAAPLAAEPFVRDCDTPIANARNLARPYGEAMHSFANGDITLISLLLSEPPCCGAHLMVLFPEPEMPFTACVLVTTEGELGWRSLSLPEATAEFDPEAGLTVRIPASQLDDTRSQPLTLDVTIDPQRGVVSAKTFGP